VTALPPSARALNVESATAAHVEAGECGLLCEKRRRCLPVGANHCLRPAISGPTHFKISTWPSKLTISRSSAPAGEGPGPT
jgi:hypothetical protein